MSASITHPEGYRTRGAQVLARFLPLHEEHAPLGFGSRAEDAVLRVGSHVGDAARLAADRGSSPLLVAVPLSWAAATALAAIPRLTDCDAGIAAAKDALLRRVDAAVEERLGRAPDCAPAELVAGVAAPLGCALAALADPGEDDGAADALFELVVAAVMAVELLERRASGALRG